MVTEAGIVREVRPRFLKPPWSIFTNPLAGKTIAVRARLVCVAPLPGANELIETPVIPTGIVAVPVQLTPAADGITDPATQKLPVVQTT